jgi:hypothetical protein
MNARAHPAFVADVPSIVDGGPRARLLQRDTDRLERTRQMLCDALEDLLQAHASIRGNDDRAVVAARRALTLGRLA